MATTLATHISGQKTVAKEQLALYKDAIDKQAVNQKVLSDAISVISNNMRRSNYPQDSAVARAAEGLELAEIALKNRRWS